MISTLKYLNRSRTHATRVAAAEVSFQAALKRLNNNDICIDCGANVGKITVQLASSGAQVYAFEPDPEAFCKLSENTAHYKNVTLAKVAVGTCDDEVPIYRSKRFSSGSAEHTTSSSLFNESYRVSNESNIKIKQINFGNFLDSLPKKPTLLKIDIEGAEVDLIEMLY